MRLPLHAWLHLSKDTVGDDNDVQNPDVEGRNGLVHCVGGPASIACPDWITFDPTNSVATQPTAINPDGVTIGFYVDMNGVNHGFVRAVDPQL